MVPCTPGRIPKVGTIDARVYSSPNIDGYFPPCHWLHHHALGSSCAPHDSLRGALCSGFYPGTLGNQFPLDEMGGQLLCRITKARLFCD